VTLPARIRLAWRRVPAGEPRRPVSRALLTEFLPGARFVSRCASCGGDHGRVRVVGVDATVSVSYVDGWAFAIAGPGHVRLGLDAVPAATSGLERVLPEGDARSWARVEAVLKADGRGLLVDPARVRVHAVADDARWSARIDDDAPVVGWDIPGPPGVILAVALG
jgi:4'-phosphopantetheinyl transferase